MVKVKYYVVTVGKEIGVYTSWEEVAPKVIGVPSAVHKSYSTEDEAFVAFGKAKMSGFTRIVGASSMENSSSTDTAANSSSVSAHRPSGSKLAEETKDAARGSSSARRFESRTQESSVTSRETCLKRVKEETLTSVGGSASSSSARATRDDRSKGIPLKSRKGKERATVEDVYSDSVSSVPSSPTSTTRLSGGSSSSAFRHQSHSDGRKEKTASHKHPETTSSPSPARAKATVIGEERSPTSSSRAFRPVRQDGAVKTSSKQKTKVEDEDEEISPRSPMSKVTYCSNRFQLEDARLPTQSHSRNSGSPAEDGPAISSSLSPLVQISQSTCGGQRNPEVHQHTSHMQVNHSPRQIHHPQFHSPIPAQYCQCDVCPGCHQPKLTQIIYLTSCQALPGQPVYMYANPQNQQAPFHYTRDSGNISMSQAPCPSPHSAPVASMQDVRVYSAFPGTECQESTVTPRVVPISYMPSMHAPSVVYDNASDPRSPASRKTGAQGQFGCTQPVFDRPSPLVALDEGLRSFHV